MPAIAAACQDETIARWIPVPVPYTEDHARQFVAERPERWQDAEHGEMTFAVTDAADGRLLGMVGPARPGRDDARDRLLDRALGPRPGRHDRRRPAGLRVRLRRARAWSGSSGGPPSATTPRWRVAEKLGFTREGTCRSRLLHRGERLDGWVGGLLAGELAVTAPACPAVPRSCAATACC